MEIQIYRIESTYPDTTEILYWDLLKDAKDDFKNLVDMGESSRNTTDVTEEKNLLLDIKLQTVTFTGHPRRIMQHVLNMKRNVDETVPSKKCGVSVQNLNHWNIKNKNKKRKNR